MALVVENLVPQIRRHGKVSVLGGSLLAATFVLAVAQWSTNQLWFNLWAPVFMFVVGYFPIRWAAAAARAEAQGEERGSATSGP